MVEITPDNLYMPIYVLTAIFGAIFVIGPFLVPKKSENRELIQHFIMITTFCMWILWVTIYIAQMHPLTPPRLRNKTMAWLVHENRDSASSPTTEQTTTTSHPDEPSPTTTPDPRGPPPPPNP